MLDYGKRVLIVIAIAACIGLLFMGASSSKANGVPLNKFNQQWIWPATGEISDHFGTRDGKHKGVDIAGSSDSDIYVVSDGIVSKSYYSNSYGHVIFVDHQMEGFETVYAHLNERNVTEGETVKKGQVIGKMGNTGHSRGVHLHFEVHRHKWTAEKENAINPLAVFEQMRQKDEIVEVSVHQHHVQMQQENDKTVSSEGRTHIVQQGETLWEIGEYYGVSLEAIQAINQISDPDLIFAGQIILIEEMTFAKPIEHGLNHQYSSFALDEMRNTYAITLFAAGFSSFPILY